MKCSFVHREYGGVVVDRTGVSWEEDSRGTGHGVIVVLNLRLVGEVTTLERRKRGKGKGGKGEGEEGRGGGGGGRGGREEEEGGEG